MSGYLRYDEFGRRQLRDPYDDRILRDLTRASPPYESARRREQFADSDRDRERSSRRRSRRGDDGLPLITISETEDRRRRSVPWEERAGELPSFARYSQSPPQRASRHRVDSFESMFGNVAPPDRSSRRERERLQYNPVGPSDPFSGSSRRRREESRREREPYGGFGEPRNPFRPGGREYDDRMRYGDQEDPDERFDETERRRRRHYRSQVGEEWGLGKWNEYEERRRYGL